MSKLENIPFEDENEEIKARVESYWTKRASTFLDGKNAELKSVHAPLWKKEILEKINAYGVGKKEKLRVLDIGCGCGFFEALLYDCDFEMTGIDLTGDMIAKGKQLLGAVGSNATLVQGDAEKLPFEDSSFDVIISRNLTWTLPHPIDAYLDWCRVLVPGGLLLNYDAEYAKDFHDQERQVYQSHPGVGEAMMEECHKIYHMLSISNIDRPVWDREVLPQLGFEVRTIDTTVNERIYPTIDEFYSGSEYFCIVATKRNEEV